MTDSTAPRWTLSLFLAPLVFAVCTHVLQCLFKKTYRWQQLSRDDNKRRSAMMALLKGVTYAVMLALLTPILIQVAKTWGGKPVWLQEPFLMLTYNILASVAAMLYLFEFSYKTVVSWDVWLHHIACVGVTGIALTGVFLGGDELQRAFIASWTVCSAYATCFNAVFYGALFAYHLQLNDFVAKKRLAMFFNVWSFVNDRAIVVVPLAYTACSWALLSATNKALMLGLLCCFVPEHIVAARTMWGIYCLNRDRVNAADVTVEVLAPAANSKCPV